MGEKALVGSPSTENGELLKMDESVRLHGIDATEAHLHSAGGSLWAAWSTLVGSMDPFVPLRDSISMGA